MAIDPKFADYLTSNKSNINTAALKTMTPAQRKKAYAEMQENFNKTGNVGNNYLVKPIKPTPAPVVPPVNPPANTPPVNTPPVKNSFGEVSESNTGVAKLEATSQAYADQQKKAAKDLAKANLDRGQEQQKIVSDSQEGARQRYSEQEKLLDKQKADAESNIDDRRKGADELLRMQAGIAARQANIGAAVAGDSGLQLSAGAMQDIKDNIFNTYGDNISTAKQFQETTNKSLDEALVELDNKFFTDKQAIGSFINTLDKEEAAPLLNAVTAALKGDTDAITAIKDYYTGLIDQKAQKEFERTDEIERLEDRQRQWTTLDQRQKGSMLSDDMFENKWAMDIYWGNPDAFKNMSYEEAKSTLDKVVKQISMLNDPGLVQYLLNKTTAISNGKEPEIKGAYEKILQDAYDNIGLTNYTQEKKTEERGDTGSSISEKTTGIPNPKPDTTESKINKIKSTAESKGLSKEELLKIATKLINDKVKKGEITQKAADLALDKLSK